MRNWGVDLPWSLMDEMKPDDDRFAVRFLYAVCSAAPRTHPSLGPSYIITMPDKGGTMFIITLVIVIICHDICPDECQGARGRGAALESPPAARTRRSPARAHAKACLLKAGNVSKLIPVKNQGFAAPDAARMRPSSVMHKEPSSVIDEQSADDTFCRALRFGKAGDRIVPFLKRFPRNK